MGDEFHAVLKLVTGEEIFALVSVDENDGDPIIMLSNPVIMKMLHSPAGQYVKVRPWLELPTEDLFLMKYDKIVTMSEVSDEHMIKFYDVFNQSKTYGQSPYLIYYLNKSINHVA